MSQAERQRLYDLVKRINLAEFVTESTGERPEDGGQSWSMICPMPFHRDSNPSFHIYREGSHWFYKCYGCDSRGSIIDFCIDYFSLDTPTEALSLIVKKHGLECESDFMEKAVKEASVDTDQQKKMDCIHYIASSTCHRLLRSNPTSPEVQSWVANSYHKMNDMLDEVDIMGIEGISTTAAALINMGSDAPAKIAEIMENNYGE